MAEAKAEGAKPVTTDGVAVVMLPLPAQGHLNQFLHLSHALTARGLPVHYVGSTAHNRQVRDRYSRTDGGSNSTINFHDVPLPHYSIPVPKTGAGAAIKFPDHLQPAFDAARHLLSPLAGIIRCLASRSRRVVLIHDSSMTFAVDAAADLPNVEAFVFQTISAIAGFLFRWEWRGKPREPGLEALELPLVSVSNEACLTEQFQDFLWSQQEMAAADAGRIYNSCRAIEGAFIDLVAREPGWKDKKTFAIGPLNPIAVSNQKGGGDERHACMEWLDEQQAGSVLYVSFGTTCTFSDEQVAELAAGLEASGRPFLWVLREADRADIYAESVQTEKLPPEYYARVEGRGKVVRDWVPQVEILAHRATGGFMTHCGWNSCMESFSAGVPMLTWPMHSDQPRNAALVTLILRVGLPAWDWEQRAELVPAAAVRHFVERLLGGGSEGAEVRRRARKLGEEVKAAVEEGGSSRADLEALVAHFSR